ncbi:SpoIIE family protein phosphatase [Frankia sp. AgB32]|uniref:PP2C family protein-serine/threonine phosphatase n=1 Tax=Frankia sp. AgB32 TaxID=631119 RepID=UPI002010506C|nr:SpoIIE family protein phosphatase [Frankia sp. AgB32]MCK9894992.1 SpoIIE family protein phosphatase [Frankia sp. AgB32]
MGETAGLRRGIRVLTLIASMAILAMLLLAVVSGVRSQHAAGERGRHLDPAATTSALLLADFVNQESALRGYIVTKDVGFLTPFDASDRSIPVLDSRLDGLLDDFPDLHSRLTGVHTAYQAWRREVVEPELAAMARGDVAGATRVVRANARRDFDALRGQVARLAEQINVEQSAASNRVESAAVLLLSSLGSAVFVIFAVLVTITITSRRWLLRPIGALQRAVNAVAAGRYDTRIPSVGPAEIVALAADVETMRAQLVQLVRQNERSWEALAQQGPAVVALRDALTPPRLHARDLMLHGRVDPAQGELAGDWYDAVELPGGRVAVIVGDVSGHGAAAGVFALRLKQLLDAALSTGAGAARAVEWAVENLGETEEMFATAIILLVEARSGEVCYVNAGHPDGLLLRRTPGGHPLQALAPARPDLTRAGDARPDPAPADPAAGESEPRPLVPDSPRATGLATPSAQIVRLPPTGPLMSNLLAAPGAWEIHTFRLEPGDVLIAYTDGLVEARDRAGRQFGVHRLVAEILRDPGRTPVALLDGAFEAVRRHAPGQQADDRTAIVLARTDRLDEAVDTTS